MDQKRHFISSYGHRRKNCEHCNESLFQLSNKVAFCSECSIVLHKRCLEQWLNKSMNKICKPEGKNYRNSGSRSGSLTKGLGSFGSILNLSSLFKQKSSFDERVDRLNRFADERRSTESNIILEGLEDEIKPYDLESENKILKLENSSLKPEIVVRQVSFRIGSNSDNESPKYNNSLILPKTDTANSLLPSPENTVNYSKSSADSKLVGNTDSNLHKSLRLGNTIRTVVQDHFVNYSDLIFLESDPIGEGGFGKVYKVTTIFNQVLALKVKKLDMNRTDSDSKSIQEASDSFLNEARVLFHLRNKFLQGFRGVTKTDNNAVLNYGILTEWCDDGTLAERLTEDRKLNGTRIDFCLKLAITTDIATGLEYLHSKNILHRDIKPENIFFKSNQVKIGDFGLAHLKRRSEDTMSSVQVGTTPYLAPEILFIQSDSIYTQASDVWSYGIMVYEIFARKLAFEKIRGSPMGDHKIMWQVVKRRKIPDEKHLPLSVRDFYQSCVKFEKIERLDFENLSKRIALVLKDFEKRSKVKIGRSFSDLEEYWLNLKENEPNTKSKTVELKLEDKSIQQRSVTMPRKPIQKGISHIRLMDLVTFDSEWFNV